MRGERFGAGYSMEEQGGSSPHARGTPADLVDCSLISRFIPACAGNAERVPRAYRLSAVHPRMRGERSSASSASVVASGSSPHARGTRRSRPAPAYRPRFIPACAGNASGHPRSHQARPVHPRMRGERVLRLRIMYRYVGSSPHARGTLLGVTGPSCRPRFIPACAGNARPCLGYSLRLSVHPRMRGERQSTCWTLPKWSGSSPHARGTRGEGLSGSDAGWFIPACAGNALPISY